MRDARILLCTLAALALSGCASRLAKREAQKESVRQEVQRLGEEQGRMLSAVEQSRERMERLLAERRKQIEVDPRYPGAPVVAEVEVISMARNPQAPFRYWGRVRLKIPASYQGKEVDSFLLSHDRDLTTLAGQTIRVATHAGVLDQQLEPMGPFSRDHGSTLAAEDRGGRFHQFESPRTATVLPLSGRIVAFDADPERKSGYFIFDLPFSGDLATVEIESPKRYRGTKLRVLVEEDDTSPRGSWNQLGGEVKFSTAETTVAWEPWGFTRAADLKNVVFVN